MGGLRRILVAGVAAEARAQSLAAQCGASLQRAGAPGDGGWAALAREAAADLLVLGPARDAHTQRWRLAPADWHALRHSPCPVLLAGASAAPAYREVLVAVDPLHEHDQPAALDDALVEAARALAPAGAHIGLVHCWLPGEYVPLRAPGAVIHRRSGSLEAHRAALGEFAGRHHISPEALRLEPGDPREAIPEAAARAGADLVVLGAVARGRLRRFLVGSTTEPVVGRLACDVLAVGLPAGTA